MSGALFSDILMVDRSPAPMVPKTPEAFAAALVEALGQRRPQGGPFLADTHIEMSGLAAAIADIVAGDSVVLRLEPGVSGHRRAAIKTFLEKLIQVTGTLEASRQEAAIARLADVLLPNDLADARGVLAADNLELRDRFVAQTAPLTSADVAARAGHKSGNPYATAARWKKAGDIFSVHHRGAEYFPAFQFREGRPHPTVKKLLAVLPENLSAWQRAFWFVSTNGWLGGKAPRDLLNDPEIVVAAARREAEEVVG